MHKVTAILIVVIDLPFAYSYVQDYIELTKITDTYQNCGSDLYQLFRVRLYKCVRTYL